MAITDTTVANTNLQEKFTDTTVDINAQFFSFSFMPIQRFIEITLTLSRIVDLPTIRYYFWSCGRWPCMVHCECWSSMFDRIHVYLQGIRLFASWSLIVWYLSLLIAASYVSPFSVILYSRTYTSCRTILKKHAAVQRKFVSVCFLFLIFWGTPYTWTYAMLTCIVCHFTLLYSWTSQTCVHDNVWLKT